MTEVRLYAVIPGASLYRRKTRIPSYPDMPSEPWGVGYSFHVYGPSRMTIDPSHSYNAGTER